MTEQEGTGLYPGNPWMLLRRPRVLHRQDGWAGYGRVGTYSQLLAEAGVRYVCDWANDEQPYPLKTSAGELFALPVMLELDDVVAMAHRKVTVERYATLLRDGFDEMYDDGMNNGRSLVLSLHPWLVGQPFRIGSLDSALAT